MKDQAEKMTTRQETESVLEQLADEYSWGDTLTTDQTILAVELCGYRLDRNALDHMIRAKKIVKPHKTGSRRSAPLEWSRSQVLAICEVLEADRKWIHGTRHDRKLTPDEIEAAMEKAAAGNALAKKWMRCNDLQLWHELIESDDREERQAIMFLIVDRFMRMNTKLHNENQHLYRTIAAQEKRMAE